jgi:hypothetical protein
LWKRLGRPPPRDLRGRLLPGLGPVQDAARAQDREHAARFQPGQRLGEHDGLVQPVERFTHGDDVEHPSGRIQVLGATHLPADVRDAPPFSLRAPERDHLRLQVDGPDLIEPSRQRQRDAPGTGGEIEQRAATRRPGEERAQ